MTKRVKQDETKLWCPGYGKCAITAEAVGRPVKRGMCRRCKTRVPVHGRGSIDVSKIGSFGQLLNP
jgi:hypothetical protein